MCSPFLFFFFPDPASTEIYTLSLHDALPISLVVGARREAREIRAGVGLGVELAPDLFGGEHRLQVALRSEEHTSELQSLTNLVCRLLLEKKKKKKKKKKT